MAAFSFAIKEPPLCRVAVPKQTDRQRQGGGFLMKNAQAYTQPYTQPYMSHLSSSFQGCQKAEGLLLTPMYLCRTTSSIRVDD